MRCCQSQSIARIQSMQHQTKGASAHSRSRASKTAPHHSHAQLTVSAPSQLPRPSPALPVSNSLCTRMDCDIDLHLQGQPLTQSMASSSALPELQTIGANSAAAKSGAGNAGAHPTTLQSTASAPAQQPGPLPGLPAQGPALPSGNLMWVNVGGNGQKSG